MTAKVRNHRPPYAAQIAASSWQIVIPISGKLAPLVVKAHCFRSKNEAEQWLFGAAGQALVAYSQEHRTLPSR